VSSFSDPAGRRLVTGLLGGLIILATGIVLYLLAAPRYEIFFYIFALYSVWVCLRFLRERHKPLGFTPWYKSRPTTALIFAVVFAVIGLVAFVKQSDSYQSDFLLALLFLGMSALTHYRMKRIARGSEGHEQDR
jgi:hypothetical protein